MVIEGDCTNPSKMGGKYFGNNKFAHSLRKNIFNEHFGIPLENLEDPLD